LINRFPEFGIVVEPVILVKSVQSRIRNSLVKSKVV